MARVLAFTQFLIVSIGVFTLHILVKLDNGSGEPGVVVNLAQFLARYALWLFAVPILFAAVANAVSTKGNEKAVGAVGIVLCLILVVLLGLPLIHHLG
jgi:bacteriorhodopsin